MKSQHNQTHPVVYAVKVFIEKLLQHPEVYPIKYYKKGSRYRKSWKGF